MKKTKKQYYYFCRGCKRAIGRDDKKLRLQIYCEHAGKDATLTLITKTKI